MNNIKKAKNLIILDDFKIMIEFNDEERRILDVSIFCNGEIFKPFLTDMKLFKTVKIDILGGLEWANGACLSPETIYLRSKYIVKN